MVTELLCVGDHVFRWSMFTPLLEVCASGGASTIRIQGSCCPCRCFSNQQFQVGIFITHKSICVTEKCNIAVVLSCSFKLYTRLSPTLVRKQARYGRNGLASTKNTTWTMNTSGWRVSSTSVNYIPNFSLTGCQRTFTFPKVQFWTKFTLIDLFRSDTFIY